MKHATEHWDQLPIMERARTALEPLTDRGQTKKSLYFLYLFVEDTPSPLSNAFTPKPEAEKASTGPATEQPAARQALTTRLFISVLPLAALAQLTAHSTFHRCEAPLFGIYPENHKSGRRPREARC